MEQQFYHRPATERGRANFGWLDSHHTFSFGSYYDSKHMGVSALRVINDDTVAPGAGFDTHGHRDMEIISVILDGAVRHEDSMGNRYVIPAGDVQVMSAGSGVLHSEYNNSDTDPVHFLQIWIQPNVMGAEPTYQQKRIEQNGQLTPLVTPDGTDGSLTIRQDASLHRLELKAGETFELGIGDKVTYLHIVEGSAHASSTPLQAGDGYGLAVAGRTELKADKAVTALYFELPA